MCFTALIKSCKALSRTGTIFLEPSASQCKKQWFNIALGALSRICFTTPERFPVMQAAPSFVIPTQYSELRPTELNYKSTELKMSSAFVVVGSSPLWRHCSCESPSHTCLTKTSKVAWLAISVDSSIQIDSASIVRACLDAACGLLFYVTSYVFNTPTYGIIGQRYGFQLISHWLIQHLSYRVNGSRYNNLFSYCVGFLGLCNSELHGKIPGEVVVVWSMTLSDTSAMPSAHGGVFEKSLLACLCTRGVSFLNGASVGMVSCSPVQALLYMSQTGVSVPFHPPCTKIHIYPQFIDVFIKCAFLEVNFSIEWEHTIFSIYLFLADE